MPTLYLSFIVALLGCTNSSQNTNTSESRDTTTTLIKITCDSSATTIQNRFLAPEGFITFASSEKSFASYLQNLPLKPMGTEVKYYEGSTKANYGVYCSVVDMDIDPVDLQQCADAVMRLRGEHLFHQGKFDEIKFNFLSDGKPRYFKDYAKGDYSYAKFRKYMKYIFSYANTGSMCDELKQRPIFQMQIGDVFVQKGRPYGHAVIVVNMAADTLGNKVFMLAQSYMPAQDTQILINPLSSAESPWFSLKEGDLTTPEWGFNSSDLKHF
ncbi:MAG: hypothetical protein COA58_01170 [Bacteroidetes bacterium]|nr:MAG: hypothetical protein COA58_01170 [Bacteroidota bacterium]